MWVMTKTPTQRLEVTHMAKAKAKVEIPEVVEVEPTEETPEGMRPKDLAGELGINPKSLRAFLRRAFPRTVEAKNTSWYLTDAQVEAARAQFTPSDDDESDETED
jgi:hypothetical protein